MGYQVLDGPLPVHRLAQPVLRDTANGLLEVHVGGGQVSQSCRLGFGGHGVGSSWGRGLRLSRAAQITTDSRCSPNTPRSTSQISPMVRELSTHSMNTGTRLAADRAAPSRR